MYTYFKSKDRALYYDRLRTCQWPVLVDIFIGGGVQILVHMNSLPLLCICYWWNCNPIKQVGGMLESPCTFVCHSVGYSVHISKFLHNYLNSQQMDWFLILYAALYLVSHFGCCLIPQSCMSGSNSTKCNFIFLFCYCICIWIWILV